jgi:NADH-quinone oxidoreductase subunit J
MNKPISWIAGLAAALALLPGAALAAPSVTVTVGAHPLRPSGAVGVAFWVLGALTVIGAVLTISRRNPVTAAVSLVGTLVCSAGVFLLLHASFMAVIQVLVYAGAIMVLFVLVVMSVEHPEHEELGFLRGTAAKVVGIAALGWLLFRMGLVVMGPEVRPPSTVPADWGTVSSISRLLFSDYLFPFEAISLLLLTAIVGAVVVTRRRSQNEESQPEPAGAARRNP